MGTHRNRNYSPKENFETYHDSFDKFQKESRIINASAETHPGMQTILWDKPNLEGILLEYQGDDKGLLKRKSETCLALIPQAQEKLDKLNQAFIGYCRQMVMMGKRKPTEWPAELLAERYRAEAKLDVITWEVETLKERIKTYTDTELEVSNSQVLKNGPIGVR